MRAAAPYYGQESPAEAAFDEYLRLHYVTGYVREYSFHATRDWRFDFAWPKQRFAVEIEGITGGAGGRHQRPEGFVEDCEKYEAALLMGWTVYRIPPSWIHKGARRIWRPQIALVLERYLGLLPSLEPTSSDP